MSSFIVSPSVINRIVTFCYEAQSNGHIRNSSIRYVLKEHSISLESYEDKQALVKNLLALNMQAVHERYGDTVLSKMPGPANNRETNYVYRYEDPSRVKTLLNVECLIYQCSEGNVPETDLFKFLEDLKNALSASIVHGLPEYEKLSEHGWPD